MRPLFDEDVKGAELHEVSVHRNFVSDSASLFLIYFLQLVVMAMYLSQEQLKLVPLLTVVFAFGRWDFKKQQVNGSMINKSHVTYWERLGQSFHSLHVNSEERCVCFVSPGWFTGWQRRSAAPSAVSVSDSASCRVLPWWPPTCTSSSRWRRRVPSSTCSLRLRRRQHRLHPLADRGSGDESWSILNNLPEIFFYVLSNETLKKIKF